MQICLIMDNPETPQHPVIAVALRKLAEQHRVRLLDVQGLTDEQAIEREQTQEQADLYLLKSHAPQALTLAHLLEERQIPVINSWAASMACQDRVLMSLRMEEARLPWPATQHFTSLDTLLQQPEQLAQLRFPLIIKSYYSHRGDLVGKLDNLEELRALAPEWSEEAIILQDFTESDGWDIKLWVIDQQIFAARRRTPLEANASKQDFPLKADEIPVDWREITLEIGRVFGLRLYGVDLLQTAHGPMIVDVNSFPGFRGVAGADDALVQLVLHYLPKRPN